MKKRRLWNVLFCLYGALMLWLLFDRAGFDPEQPYFDQMRYNLTPMKTVSNYLDVLLRREYYVEKWGSAAMYLTQAKHAFINLAGNVVMFIPLGFLLPKVSPRHRKFLRTVLSAAGILLAVELAQLFTLLGSCDVDDLILNLLGVALGYCAYKVTAKK